MLVFGKVVVVVVLVLLVHNNDVGAVGLLDVVVVDKEGSASSGYGDLGQVGVVL